MDARADKVLDGWDAIVRHLRKAIVLVGLTLIAALGILIGRS